MRILVATTQVPFVYGGAEVHASNLVTALRQHGHDAEIVAIPFKWYPAPRVLDHMMACRLLDLSEASGVAVDRVIALKFPAYLVPHPHKVAWILHQHRSAYELWGTPFGDIERHPEGLAVRDAIHAADNVAFAEMAALYANSQTVARRLERYNGIRVKPLYHPPADASQFYSEPAQDYLFYPSRIESVKRQDLVLQALALCRQPVRLVFCGGTPDAAYGLQLRQKAEKLGVNQRVEWRGLVSPDEKLRLYAQCRGVVFPPYQEDLGYITMEAMLAAKPVVTCTDAGGPLEFVEDGATGWVTAPTAQALADAMDQLWADPSAARERGHAGRESYQQRNISWANVVQVLTA